MLEDHRAGPRHDSLLTAYSDDESNSGWMISYIDIMTLLVALFVIIIAAAGVTSPTWKPQEAEPETRYNVLSTLDIPLPIELASVRKQREGYFLPPTIPGELSQMAISAALGVAGLPQRRPIVSVPPLLARVEEEPSTPEALTFDVVLPRPLLPTSERQLVSPLADYMVLLTDRPPVNVQEVEDEAVDSTLALDETLLERVEASPYLPNLEGVEVSRVAEGISLRVQDQLLFPSAAADLSEGGSSLVSSLMETIQRYEGEVWVEGHSDSQSINTPEFSSNWALSSARAIAIVEALEAAGVEPQRLRAVGLAATRPLEDNSTEEGRARNRRVEVVIHVE
ncbi:OmpA family protein [Halomonas sp. GFAJ-1]|uniref:OmpA family protein n=1 Tax=Halomonas sp. GFAJ-1 TaxID=1118153 RepID=UPI00023A385B|nr:OmpA family protein [Halomonas sp. GFAJ-1]AVI63970.1 flagellar motor protein MotB [Halomonas sp. GFAJ-1]EHK61016.1 OmpA/MotB protein [Halomonas sp. GFAJ-1]